MGLVATAAVAVALATASPAAFLQAHQGADGGFADAGGTADTALTSWATLGLAAADADTGRSQEFLRAHEDDLRTQTDLALAALAEGVGRDTHLLDRLSTQPSRLTNAAIWTILAYRQAGRTAPKALVAAVRARQHKTGGWAWLQGGKPDSNDTAAAIQALRSAGVGGPPLTRGLAALRTFQNADGGFELSHGRGSDAQSTAWAIQAYLAAGRRPPRSAYAYLARLRRPDGSYRYSTRYAVTPVWVTAQVLPALAGKPFPLR
jgi:Prenyltransferase and squalene oxidase repeat